MSGSPGPATASPAAAQTGPAGDPSMEDILASIRRILSEDEAATPAAPDPEAPRDDVLVLEPSMLVPRDEPSAAAAPPPVPPSAPPAPAAALPADGLVAPEAAAAAASSVGSLVRTLSTERTMLVTSQGPTIEDIVRQEIRPLLKAWLDSQLPPIVERLVRAEIERVIARAVP